MKRGRAIVMPHELPAGAFIIKKVHVENALAAARAYHRSLFLKSVLLHDIQRAGPKLLGEHLLDNDGAIWRGEPAADPGPRTLE